MAYKAFFFRLYGDLVFVPGLHKTVPGYLVWRASSPVMHSTITGLVKPLKPSWFTELGEVWNIKVNILMNSLTETGKEASDAE